MKCPNCGFDGEEGALECPACGLVFEKWRKRHPETPALPPEDPIPSPVETVRSPESASRQPLSSIPDLPNVDIPDFSMAALRGFFLRAYRFVHDPALALFHFLRDSWTKWLKSQAKNRAEERMLIAALLFAALSLFVFSGGLWLARHPRFFETKKPAPIPIQAPIQVPSEPNETLPSETLSRPEDASPEEPPPAEETVPEEPPPAEETVPEEPPPAEEASPTE